MNDEKILIQRDVQYAEPDGTPLSLDIFQPVGAVSTPVLMLIHGGGWCTGSRQGCDKAAENFAADGYLAVTVSYRLAPAFPYPAACDDVRAAAAWVQANAPAYGGNPARLGAYGGSAGAHLVMWLATEPDSPLTCGVAWAGPTDLRREPVTYPYRSYALAFMGACLHDAPQAYADASPLLRLRASALPMLLVHGKEDTVVSVDHARWMAQAAQEIGAPVEVILLDGVGHTGGDPNDPLQAPAWQATLDFLSKHLRERS